MTDFGVSLLICTHNGAQRLPAVLECLAAQNRPAGLGCEVVLIDNASTDSSGAVAQDYWQRLGAPFPLRVVIEPRLGVAHARCRGITEVAYPVLSFVDDDNLVRGDWCAEIAAIFEGYPRLGVLAARGEPISADGSGFPDWYRLRSFGYGVGPQAAERRYSGELPRWYSAGMSFRTRAARALLEGGYQPTSLGRQGQNLGAGEDSEWTALIVQAGWDGAYCDRLRFKHLMPAGRLTVEYAKRMFRGLGECTGMQELIQQVSLRPRAPVTFLQGLLLLKMARATGKLALLKLRSDPVSQIDTAFWSGRILSIARVLGNAPAIRRKLLEHISVGKPGAMFVAP